MDETKARNVNGSNDSREKSPQSISAISSIRLKMLPASVPIFIVITKHNTVTILAIRSAVPAVKILLTAISSTETGIDW